MKILVWGTGIAAEEFMNACKGRNVSILSFIDNNATLWGRAFHGKKIIPPAQIFNFQFDYIVVTSGFFREINAQLIEMKISDNKILLYSYNKENCLSKLGRPSLLRFLRNSGGAYSYAKSRYKELRIFQGIADGNVYIGPKRVEIYPTYHCNLHCIACWTFSPLSKRSLPPRDSHLPAKVFLKLINDLADMGTERITIVGGGEPFLHPYIFEAISLIKKRKMQCVINTGLHAIKLKDVDRLFDLSVDALICSIWAGNSESYIRTHPFADNRTFEKIRQILLKIKSLKASNNNSSPKILLHNVICNLNYKDVIDMIDFGLDVGAEELRFTPIDVVPGETDGLMLSEYQNRELLDLLEQEKIGTGRSNILRKKDKSIYISGMEIFIERTKKRKGINVDQEMIKKLPCTIGWLFAIIHPTGDVIPCCKGGRHPLGNILHNSIKEIWRSRQYGEFRQKARDLSKDDPYFKNIKCFKFCDNISDLIAYDPKNNDREMKALIGRLTTVSKRFRKLPERLLDEIFKTKLPAAKEINEYLPLPLEGLEMNDSDQRNSFWPLTDLQKHGFFRDDSGARRAKKIQDQYASKNNNSL